MRRKRKTQDFKSEHEYKKYLNARGILPKWHYKTLKDFDNDPSALSKVEKYVEDADKMLYNGIGLFLWGANGTGKTLLMTTAFKKLISYGYSVKIMSLSSLIAKFTAGWYDAREKKELLDTLQKVDFLGIEEVGKEFRSQNSDLGTVVFDNIVRYRVQMMKPTWFTSNIKPSSIKDTYTEDVSSMLKECCYDMCISGKDRRNDGKDRIKNYFELDQEL